MNIRPAGEADLGFVGDLWNRTIRETLVTFNSVEKTGPEILALLEGKRRDGHGFFVAHGAGGPEGFALYGQFRAGAGYARTAEHTILLDPAARGRGTGRRLMAVLEAHAAAAGIHTIFAGVSSGNPPGRAFHAAIGYSEVVTLREVGWKWGRWLDLHLMQKTLSPPGAEG